jgi:hypothetical protein
MNYSTFFDNIVWHTVCGDLHAQLRGEWQHFQRIPGLFWFGGSETTFTLIDRNKNQI